jgi:hypothetical protein
VTYRRRPARFVRELLESLLVGSHGFAPVAADASFEEGGIRHVWRAKKLLSSRVVILATMDDPSEEALVRATELLRRAARSWAVRSWVTTGVHLVLESDRGGTQLPTARTLQRCISTGEEEGKDPLLLSIMALDVDSDRTMQVRSWGQLWSGKLQDAIASALATEHAKH